MCPVFPHLELRCIQLCCLLPKWTGHKNKLAVQDLFSGRLDSERGWTPVLDQIRNVTSSFGKARPGGARWCTWAEGPFLHLGNWGLSSPWGSVSDYSRKYAWVPNETQMHALYQASGFINLWLELEPFRNHHPKRTGKENPSNSAGLLFILMMALRAEQAAEPFIFQIIPGTNEKYIQKENTVINLSLKPEGSGSTYRW